jgi:hypothetical protein
MGTGRRLVYGLMLCTPCFAAEVKGDTARMARHLSSMRGGEFAAAQFQPIQDEYLAWIDSRVRTRGSAKTINEELRQAKLLFRETEGLASDFGSHAGYLGAVQVEPIPEVDDLLALRIGIYTGGGCDYDETVVLYERKPFRRLGWLNAEQSYSHGYYLHGLNAGKNNPARSRIIASAWTASNCTSVWNGTRFRIDLLQPQVVTNILNREASARNDEEVKISIQDNNATFRYSTDMRDTVIQSREGVASYQVLGNRAIRQAPIASQLGGFIDEWLLLDDDEAARVSTPAAAKMHHNVAAGFARDFFEWKRVSDCSGPVREIIIQGEKSRQTFIFLLRFSSLTDMQMLSVSDKGNPSCREIDLSKDPSPITTLLPR